MTSTEFTELRPTFTCARVAKPPGCSLNRFIELSSWPNAGRPTKVTSLRRSSSIVPSTDRSGRAPFGNAPSSATSTVTVPFCTDGSTRVTRPGTMPLRVSIDAGCPTWISLAWVSGTLISAFSREGLTIRARLEPGVLVIGRDDGSRGALLQDFILELHAEAHEPRFAGFQLENGVLCLPFEGRIAQFENDTVGFNGC